MSGISPSGVASLRAKFEQKDDSTSPPSRGRSPAASLSVTGDASRPFSKVRTSFIAVEPSGQMGDFSVSEEQGKKGDVVDREGAKEFTMDGVVEKLKTNGIDSTPQKSTKKEENTSEEMTTGSSPKEKDSTSHNKPGLMNGFSSSTNPDKPTSTAEDNNAPMLASDPEEEAAVSGGAALHGETLPLGSILKGSPFEQDGKKGEASSARENGATAEPNQPSEEQAKDPSTPITNGKPKEAQAQKVGLQSKTTIASRPSAIGKKTTAQPASSPMEQSQNKPQTSTLPAPSTPNNTRRPGNPRPSERLSPRSATSKDPKKEAIKAKATVVRPSQPSVVSKSPAAASKPAQKPGKRPSPTSPPSFKKPRPKSPTRPIRLPGSATAPTAASAAKVDAAPAATSKPRDRIPSNPTSLQQKQARTSLSAGSKPVEKVKNKPKSRLSTTSSKTPEGSFLDRMMRPTQSSFQKTHEKGEVRTPPKKTNTVRPKRKSDGSEKAKIENVETKGEQPTDLQAPVDSSEGPSANGANNRIDEAAPASDAPLSSH